MSMSRQHFELVAKVLYESSDLPADIHELIRERFACALATTNSRFDRERFLRAASRSSSAVRVEVAS